MSRNEIPQNIAEKLIWLSAKTKKELGISIAKPPKKS